MNSGGQQVEMEATSSGRGINISSTFMCVELYVKFSTLWMYICLHNKIEQK